MRAQFIVFEGGEGAGKSTQAKLLATAYERAGRDVVLTREPGATSLGATVRSLLLDPGSDVLPRAEALLYAADRAQHVGAVIVPALRRGAVVISDRYVASSLAYQGAGRDLAPDDIARLSEFATDGVAADRTVLLDIAPELGLARARGASDPDRLETEQIDFHRRVRAHFRQLATAGGDSWLVLDAALEPGQIHEQIATWLGLGSGTTVAAHREQDGQP